VNVPGAPTTTIVAPAEGAFIKLGATTTFTCTAIDEEDGAIPNGSIAWISSADGELGAGATVQNALVSLGDQEITCSAVDSDGLRGADAVLVHVVDRLPPTVTITAPADGAFFASAQSITFSGRAVDADGAPVANADLRWLDGAAPLGSGAAVTTILAPGDHLVALAAADGDIVGRAEITVHVVDNVPPLCSITTPREGASLATGQSAQFTATCTNADGPVVENAAVRWDSDVDGLVGRGLAIQNALVTPGAHTITVCAADPADAAVEGCDAVAVVVGDNASPLVTIQRPDSGDSAPACRDVTLQCSAVDPEGSGVTVRWSDNRGNAIPAGGFVNWRPTTGGVHVLTCSATDTAGASGTASVSMTIDSPTVSIADPRDGDQFDRFERIDFDGSGCDAALGDLAGGELVWSSNRDGALGTGERLSTTGLSVGDHVVTLTASNGAQTASDTIQVTIRP
jgi:hypothetical protein